MLFDLVQVPRFAWFQFRFISLAFLSYFFVKKHLLVGASGMLWMGQWVSEWVRDVCMSHQSDWIYYKQPIKLLVLKVNGTWQDLILIQFRTAIFILLYKRRKYSYMYIGFTSAFSVGRRRILVMDEMSLEVWNSAWGKRGKFLKKLWCCVGGSITR